MSDKNIKTSEEVDLGQLFKIIGDGFKSMFNGILNVIKSIFHYIILTLIFLKKNAIVLGIATVIGAAIGFYKKSNSDPVYFSKMDILANYGSAKILYPKIDYLNNLIEIQDTDKLASLFNITTKNASLLSGFEIEPLERQKQLLKHYDDFKVTKDTIITKYTTFDNYAARFNDVDLAEHEITAFAINPQIISSLSKGIQKIVETDYFSAIHNKKKEEIAINERMIESDLKKLDTLRQRYNKVAILEASKQNTTSSLNLSSTSQNSKERNFDLDIFKENNNLTVNLLRVNRDKVKYRNILSIVSDFSIGVEDNSFSNRLWIKYAIIGFILSLLFLLFLKINKFLNNYSK